MPKYDYDCPKHGRFEQIAGYDDSVVPCVCGRPAQRRSVYRDQCVSFRGGGFTKTVVPPPGSVEAQDNSFKELRKSGWDEDRALSQIRKNTVEGKDGKKKLNLAGMSKE